MACAENVIIKGRMGVRGKRERHVYDGEPLSITELLQKPGVVEYLERGGPLTDGERRNKLRRELKVGTFTKEAVDQFLSHRQRGTPRKEPRFGFDGGHHTLTEILDRNPDIRQAYEASGVRTSHGQRNKLREDLLNGRDPRQQRQDSRKPKGGKSKKKKKKSKRPKDVIFRDEELQPPPEVVPRRGRHGKQGCEPLRGACPRECFADGLLESHSEYFDRHSRREPPKQSSAGPGLHNGKSEHRYR